jgi:hypothetical protein
MQEQVTAAVRPSCEALAAELPKQAQLSIDETGTKEAGDKAWLWTFVARTFTVFTVRATREATALTTFLGEQFCGIVNCDRAKMYWRLRALQWCWAHLWRDFQAMIDSGDPRAKHLGFRLRRATCELFEHWADYRGGKISRAAFLRRMGRVRRKMDRLLLRGTQCGHAAMPRTHSARRTSPYARPIRAEGDYTFYTTSDDASRLWIDGQLVVDNDGQHAAQERSGSVTLAAGVHTIEVGYTQLGGNRVLEVSWEGPNLAKTIIPADALFHIPDVEPPAAPQVVMAVGLASCVRLEWTRSTDDTGMAG